MSDASVNDQKNIEKESVTNIEVDLNGEDQNKDKPLSDDLFFSTISDPSPNEETEEPLKEKEDMDELFRINSNQSNDDKEIKDVKLTDDENDDPFNPDNESKTPKSEPPTINIKPVVSQKSIEDIQAKTKNTFNGTELKHTSFDDIMIEDEEDRDKFLDISLSDPTKVGDGMGSYMVYRLTIKTNFPAFKSTDFTTSRRFSDFLNLYEKLKEKHQVAGRILPPAPEKDMIGTAKVKMSKDDTTPIDFIGKRRAALERFLNRLGKHKTFRYDPDFRDFIEIPDELPKATNTSALSGAGMVKMFKNLTDSVSKIAIKMEETDQWFEEKTRRIDNLHIHFTKMHTSIDILYSWRRDLTLTTKEFSKGTAILANSEEQLNLSRALSQLGEIYEKIDMIYAEQANSDYFMFGELIKDYIGLLDNIKEVFHARCKAYSNWKKTEELLKNKKDNKTKLEAANKLDKIPTAAAEIRDYEIKVEKYSQEFEQISNTIKEEMKRFDFNRSKEIKAGMNKYLQTLLSSQKQLVSIWEQYLPQVKAI